MTDTAPITNPVDFAPIKARQHSAWSAGDYSRIGSTLQLTGEELAERIALRPGSTVLDVAAGNGNATLAFARRFADVTSTDYVEGWLELGRNRAEAEGLSVHYQVADAENLPFDDESFDAVVSTFGVMFTPDQERAAKELIRVCQHGGTIGLANWTPSSFIGGLFRVIGKHVPPAPGVASPAHWGTERWLGEQFGELCADIEIKSKQFAFVYPSPEHFVAYFRTYYGPVHKAFLALPGEQRDALELDILALIREHDIARDGSMRAPADYLEVKITR